MNIPYLSDYYARYLEERAAGRERHKALVAADAALAEETALIRAGGDYVEFDEDIARGAFKKSLTERPKNS